MAWMPCEPSKQEILYPIIRANRKLLNCRPTGVTLCCLGQSTCYFNWLTRVARWLADYPEWLQFCWDFVKPPRNDEIALQHFFFLAFSSARIFFSISFVLHAIFFFQQALAGIFF